LWKTPFAISGIQDLSIIYPSLEDFFIKRMLVKKATPSMLILEIKRMASQELPQISDIRKRLIEVGTLLARSKMDDNVSKALDALKEIKFLPKKIDEDVSALVGLADDFAIPDHQQYSEASAGRSVLLDFKVAEVQILHVIFSYLGLTQRYLSALVSEESMIGDETLEDETLSIQLREKAYALLW
jgi:hypothetical protein